MQRIILATGIHVSQWIGFKPEGLGVAPSHLGCYPKNLARAVSPMQPDQRVTLSLETPLIGFHP